MRVSYASSPADEREGLTVRWSIETSVRTLVQQKRVSFGMPALMCCICKENFGQVSVTVRERERGEMDVFTAQIKSRPGVHNCDAN